MLNRFRQFFSKPKPKVSDESREFITTLARSDIWILGVGIRGAPALPDINDPAAFDVIADHRIDVAEMGDDDSVFPFNYESDGKQIFPFFSTEERAKSFIASGRFGKDLGLFQPCRFLAGFVATEEFELFALLLDPGTNTERRLSEDERLLLRYVSTSA